MIIIVFLSRNDFTSFNDASQVQGYLFKDVPLASLPSREAFELTMGHEVEEVVYSSA
jgi:hypothetical protein